MDSADGLGLLVLFPSGAGEVSSGDALDGDDGGFFDEHGAARELIGEGLEVGGVLGDVGGEEVVLELGAEHLEPEETEGGEEFSFVGDGVGHDAVVGADAVGGDDEEGISEVVDIADFATSDREGQRALEEGVGHVGDDSVGWRHNQLSRHFGGRGAGVGLKEAGRFRWWRESANIGVGLWKELCRYDLRYIARGGGWRRMSRWRRTSSALRACR